MLQRIIQLGAGIVAELAEEFSVAGVKVVIDKALDPVERVAEDAVGLVGGVQEILTDELVVAESDKGCSLGCVGISCPGKAVAPFHEYCAEIVLEKVETDGVGCGVPDSVQHRVICVEAAFVIGRPCLADKAHILDSQRLVNASDVDPGIADAFIKFVVEFETEDLSVPGRNQGFPGMAGAGVEDCRLVEFADAALDLTGKIVTFEFQPAGAYSSEIEHQVTRRGDGHIDVRCLTPHAEGLGVVRDHRFRFQEIDLQVIVRACPLPSVGHKWVGRGRDILAGLDGSQRTVGFVLEFRSREDMGLSLGRCGEESAEGRRNEGI